MILLQEEVLETRFKRRYGQQRLPRGCPCRGISRQAAEQHLIDRAKEAFNTAAAPWHPGFREHQPHLEIGTHLLQMVGGEITAVVRDMWPFMICASSALSP